MDRKRATLFKLCALPPLYHIHTQVCVSSVVCNQMLLGPMRHEVQNFPPGPVADPEHVFNDDIDSSVELPPVRTRDVVRTGESHNTIGNDFPFLFCLNVMYYSVQCTPH